MRGFLQRQSTDQLADIQRLEDELSASNFARECERKWEQEKRRLEELRLEVMHNRQAQAKANMYELVATEALEVGTSIAAGSLSTWKSGGVPVGGSLNVLIGGAGKLGSCLNPDSRALRVASKAGKVLLHTQIGLITRGLILGNP